MTFTDMEIEFIKKNIVGIKYAELTEMINAEFGTNYKYDTVKKNCNRLGISNFINKWSDKEKEYLLQNYKGKSYKTLAEEVSRVIGIQRSARQVRDECYFLGVKNNRDTRYKNGHVVWSEKPIGHERKGSNGKTYIKVSNNRTMTKANKHNSDKNYVIKHNYMYQKAHGEIPRNCVVIFADGNKQNFKPNNLVCVPISAKQIMNANNWQFPDDEMLRKTAIRCAVLESYLKKICN